MKFVTAVLATFVSFGAIAHDHWDKKFDKMSFEDAKAMMQEKAQKKTAMINKFQTCINDAKDKEALKKCKEDKQEDKRAMKKDMKSKHKQSQEEDGH